MEPVSESQGLEWCDEWRGCVSRRGWHWEGRGGRRRRGRFQSARCCRLEFRRKAMTARRYKQRSWRIQTLAPANLTYVLIQFEMSI